MTLPPAATIPDILQQRAAASAERVAIVLRMNRQEVALTPLDLVREAGRYAARYAAAGIGPGDIVGDLLPPGADLIHAFFGAMFLGAVPAILPFPTEKLDPLRYRESLQGLLHVTRPAALVADEALAAELRQHFGSEPGLKAVFAPLRPAGGDDEARAPEMSSLPGASLAVLQHSSGTTGLQKGVALSHTAVLNQIEAYLPALHLTESDVIVSWLPLYHDMGLIAGFLLPIIAGVKLVLLSPFEWVRAPWTLLQAVSDHRGTLSWLPNFAYNFCAQRIPDYRLEGIDLSSWRAVINCSEPMYAESHRIFVKRLALCGLRAEALATCYAMAENVFAVTQGGIDGAVRHDPVDAEELARRGRALPVSEGTRRTTISVSAGPPLPNCEVRVVDEAGGGLGERQVGELALRSNCMLTGYYNRPDATAKALRDGWYLTGDLGYLADGQVYITGRKKDLMIVGGKNVYPQDIEYLINLVPGVHPGRAVVFGVPRPDLGTEEVVAVAEVDPVAQVDAGRLSLAIREAVAAGSEVVLGDLKLVDGRWLVKTSSGKIARGANRDKYLTESAPGSS